MIASNVYTTLGYLFMKGFGLGLAGESETLKSTDTIQYVATNQLDLHRPIDGPNGRPTPKIREQHP